MISEELQNRAAEIASRWQELMPALGSRTSRDKKGWVCPLCGHGNHGDGLIANKTSGKHGLICYGCGFSGDVIALYKELHQGMSFPAAVDELGQKLGIVPGTSKPKEQTFSPIGRKEEPKKLSDHSEYYAKCKARLTDPRDTRGLDYLQKERGISLEIAQAYAGIGVGYNPVEDTAGTGKHFCPRLIIPSGKSHYIARRVDGQKEFKVLNSVGDEAEITYLQELDNPGVCFVVEGAFDGMSIQEAGGRVVVLNSTSNSRKFLAYAIEHRPQCVLVIAMDNDMAGNAAKKELSEGLAAAKIPYRIANLCRPGKDINDELMADRAAFIQNVREAMEPGDNSQVNPYTGLLQAITAGKYLCRPTGIKEFDNLLGGGPIPGQVILIGAPPGSNKTATCQWVAEHMAQHNQDFRCLFFCLEMSSNQLLARSLARLMYEQGIDDMSTFEILQGRNIASIKEGLKKHSSLIGNRVRYNPGADCGESFPYELGKILEAVRSEEHIDLVVVDYIQLINAGGRDEGDNITRSMKALGDIAKERDCIVMAVMANNRTTNQKGESSLAGGRGSSSLEYGADSLLTIVDVEKVPGRRAMTLEKARLAKAGKDVRMEFSFDGRHMRLYNLDSNPGTPESKEDCKINDDLVSMTVNSDALKKLK